jgi:hypothetical protein
VNFSRNTFGFSALVVLILLGVGAVLAGAGVFSHHRRNEDYIPSEEVARHAVASYLEAWKRGERGPKVENTSPAVFMADTLQSAGRPLQEYDILGPAPADTPRCFLVRMVLGSPREERRERYIVIGKDPLWVFRFDDFEMITHWCQENRPKPAEPGPTAAR